jgi:protein ImuB
VTVGALVVPDLALQALRRTQPALGEGAYAVARGEGASARILAASLRAQQGGVRRGQVLSEALLHVPELSVRWLSPELLADARAAVADAAGRVSPRVELAPEGSYGAAVAWIDAEGLGALFGEPRQVASALVASAHRVGFAARAAIAPGKRIAQLAAEQGEGLSVVTPGEARSFLARLPLFALTRDPHLRATLQRWGLRTAGELAALPADGVGTRLGAAGVLLHRLASGEEQGALHPLPPPERFEEGCHLDHVLVALEGLLFLLRPALVRLMERLDCRGFVCGALSLHLLLEPSGEAVLPIGLAGPTREVGALLSLCRSAMEARPPNAPVRGLRLSAVPARVRGQQLGLWDLPQVAPMRVLAAVAQVAAIVGPERVGSAVPAAQHLAEAHALQVFAPEPPPARLPGEPLPQVPPPLAALRCFRPPLPAEVRVGPRGPEALFAAGVNGWVVAWAGPWRLDVGWHDAPVRRDAFDVELSDGAVYRVAQAGEGGAWCVLARYD